MFCLQLAPWPQSPQHCPPVAQLSEAPMPNIYELFTIPPANQGYQPPIVIILQAAQ
jgi:hypothetical protein